MNAIDVCDVDYTQYPEKVFGLLYAILTNLCNYFTARAAVTDCVIFVGVFFSVSTITHESLQTA